MMAALVIASLATAALCARAVVEGRIFDTAICVLLALVAFIALGLGMAA